MDCKPTFTRPRKRARTPLQGAPSPSAREAGASLAEYLVALGVGVILFGVIATLTMFSSNSFAVTGNFVDLDQQSRYALDYMSREIRQADRVVACAANNLSLQSGTNVFTYLYDATNRLIRRQGPGASVLLLKDCDYLRFDMFQRNATNGTYDYYPTASTNTCKVVQLTWLCSKKVWGSSRHNTTLHQSAKVVIRKQR